MTKTWTDVRRQLARELREPFFRRVGSEITINDSSSTLYFQSLALHKIENAYGIPYGFAYVAYTTDGLAPLGEELEITNYLQSATMGTVYTDPVPSASWSQGDKVELHTLWSAQEKADAVNRAINDCWPAFYREVKDETIIVQKFKRQYDLTTLAVRPRHVVAAYIEPIFRVGIGLATAGGATTLTDANVDYTQTLEAGKTYKIAIFYGTGMGQERTISSYDTPTRTFTVSQAWDTNPDSTSEYMVKNTSDVYYNWLGPLTRVRLDQDENPNTIEILYDTYEIWGARLRLVYAADLPQIAGESTSWDDAVAGYLMIRAKYHLYLERIGAGPQFEVKTAATLADSYDRESDKYRDRNRMKRLSSTIKTDQGYINWSDREMPFRR